MALYLIKKIIYEVVNKNPEFLYLLETREIWIIPVVNVDSYKKIGDSYLSSYYWESLVKN